jgi:hypothetical protein
MSRNKAELTFLNFIATLSARAGSANIFVYNSSVHIPDSYKLVEEFQQRLNSCNFHRIQTHLNRPILHIGLIVKYKTIIFLKSKNLTCGTCGWLILKSKSSINDIEDSYISYHLWKLQEFNRCCLLMTVISK